MQGPQTVEVQTGPSPTGSVIWLHGLGADGHDFEPVVPELHLPEDLELRFVFPHAPMRPVTINGGMEMRAWYDIVSLDTEGRADESGIRESSAILAKLIEAEQQRGIDVSRIVIAGFSQGGAIAIQTVLAWKEKLAGLMALSTYLPLPKMIESEHVGDTSLPVFMGHGSFDPMVTLQMGQHARDQLQTLGYSVDWHEYPMAHGVCPQEITDISAWLQSIYTN
jgi:phospholipase/carboxylesterase